MNAGAAPAQIAARAGHSVTVPLTVYAHCIDGPAGHLGISFYGTQLGIIAAMLFVSVPFAVNSARVAFEAIDPRLELAARSLGATPWYTFRRITLPLGLRGVLTGAVLVYAPLDQ